MLFRSIFIKILLFNLSLLFLPIRYCLGVIPFSWAFQPFFFSQVPSTSGTNHKHKHKPTPIKNPPNQTIKPTKPPIRNPRRQFETHRSKPIQKKSSLEPPQPQPNHDLTTTNDQRPTTHFSRRSTTDNPLHPSSPIHDQRPSSTTDPRPTTRFIPTRRSTTNDPLHPSSPIHDHDPTTTQTPNLTTNHNHAKNHNHY